MVVVLLSAGERRGVSVGQLFPISAHSTAVSQSQPYRARAAECSSKMCQGPEIPPIKGSSQFVYHIHGAHQHLKPALVQQYVQIHNQKSKRVSAIWESLNLFLIVSRPFTPTQLCYVLLLSSFDVGSVPLACSAAPHAPPQTPQRNLRLATL